MNVKTKFVAGCDSEDNFPAIWEDLPGIDDIVYSNEGNVFRVVKIVRQPSAGTMIPVLFVDKHKEDGKTVLCG